MMVTGRPACVCVWGITGLGGVQGVRDAAVASYLKCRPAWCLPTLCNPRLSLQVPYSIPCRSPTLSLGYRFQDPYSIPGRSYRSPTLSAQVPLPYCWRRRRLLPQNARIRVIQLYSYRSCMATVAAYPNTYNAVIIITSRPCLLCGPAK